MSDDGGPTVNAEFFVLAFTAAINPKLLGAYLAVSGLVHLS